MASNQVEMVSADRLDDELDRLIARFSGDYVAVEALEAVRWWLMEETVPGQGKEGR